MGHLKGGIIGMEIHELPGKYKTHLHIVLKFNKKLDIKNAHLFWDYKGFHPHIQVPRCMKACIDYCQKEDQTPIKWGDIFDDETYTSFLDTQDKDEAFMLLKAHKPRDAVHNGVKIMENWQYHDVIRKRKAPPISEEEKLLPFVIPHAVDGVVAEWMTKNLLPQIRGRKMLLILHGPSRTGKTEWVKSWSDNAIYMQSCFCLQSILDKPDANLLIFDDMEWDKVPCRKALLGAKGETILTDKYHKKVAVRIDAPAVWITNTLDYQGDREWRDYWKYNCIEVRMDGTRLY